MTASEILAAMAVDAAKEATSLAIALVREYAESQGQPGATAAKWARQRLQTQRAATQDAKARAKARTRGK